VPIEQLLAQETSQAQARNRAKPECVYRDGTPSRRLFLYEVSIERFLLVGEEVKATLKTLNTDTLTLVSFLEPHGPENAPVINWPREPTRSRK
jgi:hypothetical protein